MENFANEVHIPEEFCVVHFVDDSTEAQVFDIVSSTWIIENGKSSEQLECWWPSHSKNVTKLVKNHTSPVFSSWKKCAIKEMRRTEKYARARYYLENCFEGNDLSSEPNAKRRKKEVDRYEMSSWPISVQKNTQPKKNVNVDESFLSNLRVELPQTTILSSGSIMEPPNHYTDHLEQSSQQAVPCNGHCSHIERWFQTVFKEIHLTNEKIDNLAKVFTQSQVNLSLPNALKTIPVTSIEELIAFSDILIDNNEKEKLCAFLLSTVDERRSLSCNRIMSDFLTKIAPASILQNFNTTGKIGKTIFPAQIIDAIEKAISQSSYLRRSFRGKKIRTIVSEALKYMKAKVKHSCNKENENMDDIDDSIL